MIKVLPNIRNEHIHVYYLYREFYPQDRQWIATIYVKTESAYINIVEYLHNKINHDFELSLKVIQGMKILPKYKQDNSYVIDCYFSSSDGVVEFNDLIMKEIDNNH